MGYKIIAYRIDSRLGKKKKKKKKKRRRRRRKEKEKSRIIMDLKYF